MYHFANMYSCAEEIELVQPLQGGKSATTEIITGAIFDDFLFRLGR